MWALTQSLPLQRERENLVRCAILILMLTGLAMAQSESKPSNWTIRGNVPPDEFVIQCHRGAGELAPENTLEAFELGWKLGTYPECDLRTTKDGKIVTFHDADFSRVVKDVPEAMKKKGVADVTWDELSRMD